MLMESKNYLVIGRSDINNFINVINELMNEGWMPIGGVKINPNPTMELGTFIQSLVKTKIKVEGKYTVIACPTLTDVENIANKLLDECWLTIQEIEKNGSSIKTEPFMQSFILVNEGQEKNEKQ